METIDNASAIANCTQTALDSFHQVRDYFSQTNAEEAKLAHEAMTSNDKIIDFCCDRISKGGLNLAQEEMAWEQLSQASVRQKEVYTAHHFSLKESRTQIFAFGAGIALLAVAVINPAAAREAGAALSKSFSSIGSKALPS